MRIMVNVAGLIALLMAVPAHATKISGKVSLNKEFVAALEKAEEAQSKGSKDFYWKLPNGLIPVRPPDVDLSSDIGVVLFRDDSAESQPDEVRKVEVETGQLRNTVIVTRPGSTLKFTNESPYVHELYSPEHPNFKPEAQSKGAFRPIEFKTEGIFEIRCKRMPHFLGYVVVTEGRTLPIGSDGNFSEEIEPGKYTIKVFYGGRWVHKKSFTAEGKRLESLNVTLKTLGGDEKRQKKKPEENTTPKK